MPTDRRCHTESDGRWAMVQYARWASMSVIFLLLSLLVSGVALAGSPPNILLLMAEDMSSRVGAFGDAVAHTPNLDRLAREGVRYSETFTTAGVCAPSRAAVITGMHQIAFGGQHMRTSSAPIGAYKAVPPIAVKAFPELLRAAGYYTYTTNKLDYQFSKPFPGSGPFTIWDEEGFDIDWRGRPTQRPFFGYHNYPVTHESGVFSPLGSWPNSISHFVMQLMRAWQAMSWPEGVPTDPAAIAVPPYYPDTEIVREDMAVHYTNISIMDAQVGELLRQLEADGLAEDTVVIWTTDHGDGLPRAKRELYDSGIKVPMIIRWPEKYRPRDAVPGSLDQRLVSFVDLAPTILALAGVELPDYLQGHDINSPEGRARQYIYASRDRIDEVDDRQRAVRDHRYKYIRSWYPRQEGGHPLAFRDNLAMMQQMHRMREAGALNDEQMRWFEAPGEERLFDLQVDPFELDDVAADPAYGAVLGRMRQAYADWADAVPDWSEEAEAAMVARLQSQGEAQVTTPPKLALIDGEVQLQATTPGASLGYRVNGGTWQLYTAPFTAPAGAEVQAKAVRYGWQESDAVSLEIPAR